MILTAVATKAELAALIASFTPLRVTIDERRGRAVTLGCPALDLVPDRGLRVRGDARITWDVAGLTIPVTIQSWQVLLVPRVVVRREAHVLAFVPVIEDLDLRLVPAFVDDKIAAAIRSAVAQNRERLAWRFTRTLSKRWPLSARIAPAMAFELVAVDGAVTITESELRLSVRFEAHVDGKREDLVEQHDDRRSARSEAAT